MHKPTVLIVDDDDEITFGTGLRLRSEGYETLTARNGADGMSVAIEQQPDVVLLDVRMPNVDGLTALRMLRSNIQTKRIPIIMLSASLRDQQTALDAAARYFLTKPYRSTDLRAAIESVLDNWTQHQKDLR